jgi:hypothetical protein
VLLAPSILEQWALAMDWSPQHGGNVANEASAVATGSAIAKFCPGISDAAELEPGSQLPGSDKKDLRDRISGIKAILREEMRLLDGRVAKFMQIVP